MQASSLITLSPSSPSFNSYSSGKLAEIAARVVQEFSNESEEDSNIFPWESDTYFSALKENNKEGGDNNPDHEEEDGEFEFAIVSREPYGSPISADDIFYNGQIRPIYPLFNTALLLDHEDLSKSLSTNTTAVSKQTTKPIRLPLGKLFSEDKETTSCSSSDADELENLPEGTYCVWTPKKAGKEESPRRCKKSSSTGSSKRWKFRDLLYRSNTDGKDIFVFLTPAATKKNSARVAVVDEGKENKEKEKEKEKEGKGMVEEHYVKSRAVKEGDTRRSFLPYRRDLVGLFSNVHSLNNLHPF